jgi:hypothetical protein
MKILRTAVASLVLMSAMPLAHAQDRDQNRDRDRDRNNVVDRDHDRDRDNDRERFRANDAAYQDGWNHGMTDGQKRHKQKIKYGHWKNNEDRQAYTEGYNRGYQSYYANNNNNRRDRDRDHDHR